jgi:type VI secretion system protein ImpA
MSSSRVIDEKILAPISAARPAGDDISGMADWVTIKNSRPNLYDVADKQDWERADAANADWATLKRLSENALCTKSKDLRIALWLTDACIRLHGFTGARDGIWAIRSLLDEYWDKGLFPQMVDDDVEMRSGPLEWLNEKLAEVIREIPLTIRAAPGKNYSLNFRKEALRKDGLITPEEFEAAAAVGSYSSYQELSLALKEARQELIAFESVAEQRFGSVGFSVHLAKEAFEECSIAVSSILRKKQPMAAAVAGANGVAGEKPRISASFMGMNGSNGASSWNQAEQMAKSGDVDGALATMVTLAAEEANGRIRFQRKLLLAEICLQTGREKLAKSILEELAELIEKHQLERWETTDVIGAVWTRLYKCYRSDAGGGTDTERATALFQKLCRLDPWQALACGDSSR